MISNFIHSLIARHLESSNAAEAAMQFVQPRPKSRFEDLHESSSIAGNELIRNSGQEPAPVFAEEQNFPQPRPSPVAKQPAFSPQHSIEPLLPQKKQGYDAAPMRASEQIELSPPRPSSETAFVSQHTMEQPILQRRQLHDVADMPAESVHRDSPQSQRYFSEFTASPQPLQSTLQRLHTQPPSHTSPDAEFSTVQRLPQQEFPLQQPSFHSADKNIAAPHYYKSNLESRIQQIVQRLNVQPVNKEYIVSPQIQEEFLKQSNAADSKVLDNKLSQKMPASMDAEKGQLTLAGELNQRIQEILRRSTMPKQDGDVKPSAATQVIVAPAPQPAFFQQQTGRAKKQSSSPPSSAPESGLLQLPSWLNEMRTELRRRWQDSSPLASPAAEPVINVTIGRVEVRAMQTKTSSGAQARPQASRVMSLDEYLKQRESRG